MYVIEKRAFGWQATGKGALIGAALGSAMGGIQGFMLAGNQGLTGQERVKSALQDAMRSGLLGATIGGAVANAPNKDKLPELFAAGVMGKVIDTAASRMVKGVAPQKKDEEFIRKKASLSAPISISAFLDELEKISLSR
jgi:hypothetical protein